MSVDAVSRFLAVLALASAVGGIGVLVARDRRALAPLRPYALTAAAAIATTATAGSLYYSEVAGFVPCALCWWQRLAMYPLAVLLVVAAVRRDDGIRPYARALASLGLLVSLWHVAVQRMPSLTGASGCAADTPCNVQWVDVLGLSIPAMAACGFVGVLGLLAMPRHDSRASRPGPATADVAGGTTDHRTDLAVPDTGTRS